MKEIKFRAWDKKNKQIAEVVAIDYLANEVMLDHFGEIYFLDFKYAELLQFTGLKDENGVEIYEGDIISSDYYTEIRIVKFENGSFHAMHKNFRYELCETNEDSAVIGNIYENPELIE